jgi:hypothetical protein
MLYALQTGQMKVFRHPHLDAILLALLLLTGATATLWAWLWPRVGPWWAAIWSAMALWIMILLGYDLAPRRRGVSPGRHCTVELFPSHVMGVVTQAPRLHYMLLLVPLGALIVIANRTLRLRLIVAASAAFVVGGMEIVQFALPRLHQTCDTVDAYDGWTGLVIGMVLGSAGLAVLSYRRATRPPRHRLDPTPEAEQAGLDAQRAADAL